MEYLIEILPSLLNGTLITLEVFFLVLILSIPLGIIIAFIMRFNITIFKLLYKYIYMDNEGHTLTSTINFYLLCFTNCRSSFW